MALWCLLYVFRTSTNYGWMYYEAYELKKENGEEEDEEEEEEEEESN